MLRTYILTLFTFIILMQYHGAQAQNASNNAQYQTLTFKKNIARIENYLNNIDTFVARFVQKNKQDIGHGTFYLSRPGKLRWEYDPPSPIIIIANNSILSYVDKELEQVSNIPLEDSLSSFLTQKYISFNKGVKIVGFTKKNNKISITIEKADGGITGKMTLVFQDTPLDLQSLIVQPNEQQKTVINFLTKSYGNSLKNSLFTPPTYHKQKN